jgi:N-acetylglucosamine-6-phosphate deacetylase
LNPEKNGIHKKEVLQRPQGGISDLEECYGANNLKSPIVKMVTLAPELDQTQSVIRDLSSRGIIVSAGHSTADYEQMRAAVKQGATMVTHLFNAMNQPHHRNPGIFGIIGAEDEFVRPYYGIIADDIHVHPSFVKVAHYAHPNGTILVTDAMSLLGLPDGRYDWTNGESIVKHGGKLTLNDTPIIAGRCVITRKKTSQMYVSTCLTLFYSCVTLIQCLVNMINWTDSSIPHAIRTVTCTPAKMLGLENVKGTLKPGADADLVVLSEGKDADGKVTLTVDEVWKFGVKVFGHTAAKL